MDRKELLQKAILIAISAHQGQKDKGGNDYINHPIFVSMLCETDDQKIVGLLHDVVEDSDFTLDDLRKAGMPEHIVQAVDAISKRKDEGYMEYLHRVKANDLARYVKLKDLCHNTMDSRLKTIDSNYWRRKDRYSAAMAFLREE